MTDRAENCGGCRFYNPNPYPMSGHCVRRAPVRNPDPSRVGSPEWPTIHSRQWCGEFRSRGIAIKPGAVMTRKDLLSAIEVLDRMVREQVSTSTWDEWERGPGK